MTLEEMQAANREELRKEEEAQKRVQSILDEVWERDEKPVKILSFWNTKDKSKSTDIVVDINSNDYDVVRIIESNVKSGDKALLQYDSARLDCYFMATREEYDFLKGYVDSDCYFSTLVINGLYLAREGHHDGSYSIYEYKQYNINDKSQLIINKYCYYEATRDRDDSSETIELATIAM